MNEMRLLSISSIRPLCLSAAFFAIAAVATGQLLSQAPQSFDVVSIKPRVGGPIRVDLPTAAQVVAGQSPDRFERPDTTLITLIREAYDLLPFQAVGGPDWISSKRWQVSAKASGPVQRAAMRDLVRRMLEDRFALKAHVETREQPAFRLLLARSDGKLGPQIKEAAVDCRPFLTGARPMAESPKDPVSMPKCSDGAAVNNGVITPRLNGQSLSGLVRRLEGLLQRRVINETGLQGIYDIELPYLNEHVAGQGIGTGDGPSLFTLLREQLGMRLVSGRGPAEVLVIDSVQEPTPN